ncbi:MAG: hypothetical protein HY820_21325 [Acidobacteria bacterium]|nr:hypothetical protein [Acidobacteriota bacterium]
MKELDKAIRQSLSADDAELFDRLDADQALQRQVLATFQGKLRWFNAVGWVAGLAMFTAACFFSWQFVQAVEVGEMLRWGAAAAVAFAGVLLIKVWFWLEMQKNAIVRELKRLELQVVSLAAQLRQP